MSLNGKEAHERRSGSRLLLALLAGLAVVGTVAVQAATGTTAAGKPVIASPVTSAAQPVAGERFIVSYKVTRSDTGTPLVRGTMICDPSVTGQVLRHAESFKGGTARLSFVVPASAAGKLLKVKVTIRSGGQSATKVSTFKVQGTAELPLISIGDASVVEGNSGTTVLSFPVTLSMAAAQGVSVNYATSDGSAVAPADYVASSGTLTFAKGQKAIKIAIDVVGDLSIEQDESFAVSLSAPVNAGIARGLATGTITNDDTAVPVSVGNYKGATQNGDFLFFTVTPNRTITGFRINAVAERCTPGATLRGSIDWTDSTFSIRPDGTFAAEGSWSGSDVQGDYEWLKWSAKLSGRFTNATSATGTLIINDELNYKGTRYVCSTGELTWSATLQS